MLKLRHTPLAFIVGSLLSTPGFAAQAAATQDDIVISASRVETKRIETGSSITILDAQYLQENQARTVAEVLQDVPGVSVSSNGGLGKTTSVFIRGAGSNKTLVIIDGVEVNDLSSITGGYSFANLMADNIERIEVLRGSQSALWGSDAMGGVINIITKKGQGDFKQTASFEVGENDYHKESVSIRGTQGNSHYSLFASNLETNGISAKTGEFDDPDDDGYTNQNVTLKAGHQFTDIFLVDGVMRYTRADSDYDSSNYNSTANADNNSHTKTRQRLAKLNTHLNLLDNRWKNRLSFSYADSKSENYDPQRINWITSESESYTENSGENIKTELQSDYFLNTNGDFNQRFTVVAETEKSTYQPWSVTQEQNMDSSSAVVEYAVDWCQSIFLTTSLRRDFNSDFDNTTTHKVALTGWATDGIRLHASHGTGVKNPTFSQLFGDYATPDLNPETSDSWDVGIEYNFASLDGYIDLTYFNADYDDAIRWSESSYENIDEKTNGVEISTTFTVTEDFRANASYTFMETDDGNGNELLRRPKHSASINANYKYTPKLSANIGARYVGKRLDYGNVDLDDYTVVNIAAAYQVNEHITVSGRIENAFDKDYEEVSGYNTDSATAYVGVSFQ